MQANSPSSQRLPFYESLPLAFVLFVFWIVLSGKLDLFHVGAGALSAIAISFMTCYLYAVKPPVGPVGRHPFFTMPWVRIVGYLPWLSWQILVASVQVAAIVLRPNMNIDPLMFRFQHELPHNLARAILANSITLTPGTVTIDVRGDEFLVHALNHQSAQPLQQPHPGDMKDRVSRVFARPTEP